MMQSIRRSISRKVMSAVLATTFLALLVTGGALVAYDVNNYQTAWRNDLTAQAEILGRVTAPALQFNDPKSAQENLEQIQVRPSVLAAAIYTADGALFARYAKNTDTPIPRFAEPPGYAIEGNQITVFNRIRAQDEIVGTVFITARYPLAARVVNYVKILAAVMLGSLVVAALVSVWLQRAITKPILDLTEVVRQVIERRNFSSRVTKSTEDEIGVLVDAFNTMLGEVGERSEALRLLNATLEERIAARTAELEAAHEQLRQSQKMEAIGQLTGGIAHDFNNLLAGMSGNIEIMQLRMSMGQTTDLRRYVDSAMASIDRAAALTHRLLAFSRRQTLDPKPTDINRLIASMEDLLKRTVGPGIRFNTRFSDDIWNTFCDPHQLENALLNLAINARDAMPDGGELLIETANITVDRHGAGAPANAMTNTPTTTTAMDYVMVRVVDNGVGMTPEVLSRAFDPFFTTKPLGQGTGLGLSMIYGFVSQSGGQIRIESEPGQGTAVKLELPRYHGAAEDKHEQAARSLVTANRRLTVLVVDDEEAVRASVVELLSTLGYAVLDAPDGRAGMALIESEPDIDLLITDVGLPNGMNGRQLADAARARRPELKVLFITGYASINTIGSGAMEAGMEVLTKPFKIDTLADKVRAMVAPVPGA